MFKLVTTFLTIDKSQLSTVVKPVVDVCNALTTPLIGVVAALGAIWCILLGVKYAKADEPQEHEKCKKALVNAVIGFALIFILLIMLKVGTSVFTTFWEDYEY